MLELTVKEGFLEETTFDLRPDTETGEGHSRLRAQQGCSRSKLAWSNVQEEEGGDHMRQQVSDGLSSFLLTSAIHMERSGAWWEENSGSGDGALDLAQPLICCGSGRVLSISWTPAPLGNSTSLFLGDV